MFILLGENFTNDEVLRVVEMWDKNLESLEGVTPYKTIWTFDNAFFFAFHLISTIGYGNISPKTASGQILSVVYAVIGIPLHILFLKLLGQLFVQSYEETVWMIKGDEESDAKKLLCDLVFFLSCTILFFIIPSVVFMFTENWNFLDGIYYSFITLTTVGLGDYVAGENVQQDVVHGFYKVFLFLWMVYGIAFTTIIVDVITHEFQMRLLFAIECQCRKKCKVHIHRIYVDIEKLDIHFRLLRSEGIKQKFSMWAIRKDTQRAVKFQTHHLANLAILTESIQAELLRHFDQQGTDMWFASVKRASISYSSDKDISEKVDFVSLRTPGQVSNNNESGRKDTCTEKSSEKSSRDKNSESKEKDTFTEKALRKSTSDKNAESEEKDSLTEVSPVKSTSGKNGESEEKDTFAKESPEKSTSHKNGESKEKDNFIEESPEKSTSDKNGESEEKFTFIEEIPEETTSDKISESEEKGTFTQESPEKSTKDKKDETEKQENSDEKKLEKSENGAKQEPGEQGISS